MVGFVRGVEVMGQTPDMESKRLVKHAVEAGVEIPTNGKCGTWGSGMVTLLMGEVTLP